MSTKYGLDAPTTPPTPSCCEPRRPSAAPSNLLTVTEVEDNLCPPVNPRHRPQVPFAPIGAERYSPPKPLYPIKHCYPVYPSHEDRRAPLVVQSRFTPPENPISPHASSSSILTSSSSRYNLSSQSSEDIPRCEWTGIDAEVGVPYAIRRPRTDDSPPLNLTGSPFVDFSTGRSIWC